MSTREQTNSSKHGGAYGGITSITVKGYKSICNAQCIDIRPLTVLAGANSSGKSSIMQPLLLLKQTLEAPYDPGSLLLDGPNLKFTSTDQLLSKSSGGKRVDGFSIGLGFDDDTKVHTSFSKEPTKGLAVESTSYDNGKNNYTLDYDMTQAQLKEVFKPRNFLPPEYDPTIVRVRCFLALGLKSKTRPDLAFPFQFGSDFESRITQIIHLPGLRGNPLRTYPVSAVGKAFPGTFEKYSASIISQWQSDKRTDILERLDTDLRLLGLTWKVRARSVNETQVELQVGRLPQPARGGARDLVSIADVGFGVSQTLPVLVALHAASPGQLVYLEQPEIHLHPRAQEAMSRVLVNAALRGVRVVVETHSNLLLLGIQTLAAEGTLPPDRVKLHWFSRSDDGKTNVSSADLDERGTFGDWPIDFADVALKAESRFLDAATDGL